MSRNVAFFKECDIIRKNTLGEVKMSIESVREYLKEFGLDGRIKEFEVSSATVELAAKALGCEAQRIAKTLSFLSEDGCILVVTAGDTKIDNAKFKAQFNMKAKMLTPDAVVELCGHQVGGVCPFAVKDTAKVYTDISLKRFDTVYPACGTSNSAIPLNCDELFEASKSLGWIDVCKLIEG